ncbi:MAG: hypothetical protein PHF86_01555 [Candidatus Nanoarchaeia archaeon]|nr:hypothetical protein [Candidatus Nanoarchaeia archaeon]
MNYLDAQKEEDRFNKILHNKFINNYPDTFIKNSTRNKEEYDSANGCMYSWFIILINAFSHFNFSPKYSQTKNEIINSDWSCVKRLVDDFEKEDNWQSFIIEHIKI